MIDFIDLNGNTVELSFGETDETKNIQHIFCITSYQDQWLCTKHSERGIEFPGGKLEENENPADAVRREVFEETGGIVESLSFIGQYKVKAPEGEFVKGVFSAEVSKLVHKQDYMETKGPILIDKTLSFNSLDQSFSFIMKDGVVQKIIEYMKGNKD